LRLAWIPFALALSVPAHAVRPFVTDDARISDTGQVEIETWFEFQRQPEHRFGMANVMVGGSVNRWLQILAGTGVGLDGRGQLNVLNPVVTPKILLWPAADDGRPGLSVAGGVTLPIGTGELYQPATGFFLFAPVTSRLLDDTLVVHVNVGGRGAIVPSDRTVLRPYWGVGTEMAVFGHHAPHLVLEVYAGDPFEPLGPPIAAQGGFRWLVSDRVNLDLTFGGQPAEHSPGFDAWGQLGIRMLFDAFTPGGRRGDPMGAPGLMRTPGRAPR
jgi:hypothetical protein